MDLQERIKSCGMERCVTEEDILKYLNAPSYEEDIYDIAAILSNAYLVLHEIMEVCCLKRKGIAINERTIMEHREKVYACHLDALEEEMAYALQQEDKAWVAKRVNDLRSYLSDPYLPDGLRASVLRLIGQFGDEAVPH